jgi:hypothetical protein
MAFAILLCISLISSFFHYKSDLSYSRSETIQNDNIAGTVGARLATFFIANTFGFFSLGFVLLFFIYGYKLTFERSILPPLLTTAATLITIAWLSTVCGCFLRDSIDYLHIPGPFGNQISEFLIGKTGNWGAGLILTASFFIILVLFYNISPKKMLDAVSKLPSVLPSVSTDGAESKKQKAEKKLDDETMRRCDDNKSPSNFEGVDGKAGRGSLNGTQDTEKQKLSGIYAENINELRNEYDKQGIVFEGEGATAVGGKQNAINGEENEEVELKIVSAPGLDDDNVDDEVIRRLDDVMIDEVEMIDDDETINVEPLEDYDPQLDLSL